MTDNMLPIGVNGRARVMGLDKKHTDSVSSKHVDK